MINPKELRIGNYLIHTKTDNIWSVDSVGSDGIVYINYKGSRIYIELNYLDPIPITPELLDRLGSEAQFEIGHEEDGPYRWTLNSGMYQDFCFRFDDGVICELHDMELPIKYIHQLQNLVFALTGKELKLKEETE